METGKETTGKQEEGQDGYKIDCNESCPWNRWLKGGCDCPEQKRLISEFKRDRVHELFSEMVLEVGG